MTLPDETAAARARRAAIQRLESLHQAGVGQIDPPPPVAPEPQRAPPPVSAAQTQTAETKMPKPTGPKPAPVIVSGDLFSSAEPKSPPMSLPERREALQVLCDEVSRCTRCAELASTRTNTVFGVGNPEARLCFFGEAPGADEDRQGEPFVGRAGQLLNKIIAACGLTRDQVYIFNVLKCRPPGNRDPAADEVANCRPYFERQLEILRPEFICCLGRPAMMALLDTNQSLGRMRGRFHQYGGSKVAVTYHPAYLLRNPPAKRDTWEDMKMLLQAMGLPIPTNK